MARTLGSRNADYDAARLALARRVGRRMLAPGGSSASLRQMATAAQTSVATLKHYFGDRSGVMLGVLQSVLVDAAPHVARASLPGTGGVRASLLGLLRDFKMAWFKHGVGPLQAAALAAGLTWPEVGPGYLNYVLEPLLQAGEARIHRHVEAGDLRPCNERYAALELLAPVVLGLLHQDSLCGSTTRPLDVDGFLEAHVEAFLAAFPAPAGKRGRPGRGAARP